MFDEFFFYFDVKQRLSVVCMIWFFFCLDDYVIVVEYDLFVFDYFFDFVCVLYGQFVVYGVVIFFYFVCEGINIFLDGYIFIENLCFCDESLIFCIVEGIEDFFVEKFCVFKYFKMEKILGNFYFSIDVGDFFDFEIIVMMGENGIGKVNIFLLILRCILS